ncbi:hypothetical protein H0H92_001034, partial [Tricholoma furcatifolium]
YLSIRQRGFDASATKTLFAASLAGFLVNILILASSIAAVAIELKGVLVDFLGGTINEGLIEIVDNKLVIPDTLSM